ncbi:PhzF family phenazine biosynthesis protein [Paenibacillus sp. TRM 82003]|uniref:PhzF family phenazine biosynthesis protein n=1 Tax=Kineococcus sp. TRM81007 TaxID=2925831 RepID=UPI001F59A4F8|nr:PhzF family phenazine biosynthesis protein [Kineococcus sp. TRM81007]MCI2240498.1 PhzF family phenazine biosynthesis protein [Kineococcus sp. TRM81007]MCI3925231.1 PhzF family phenazine biosynthesis protein [Paenibacillus sp. TRM 82003]
MPRPRPFAQVDVFSPVPYRGNPVAVVLDAEGLDAEAMQRFAAWTNLSETTFVLPPSDPAADYRLRIFTPGGELPFAGHPTLGSAHAWLGAGGRPHGGDVVVQECGAGLVPVRRDGAALSFAAPPLVRSGPLEEEVLDRAVRALGLAREDVVDHRWVDNGPGWAAVRLASARAVLDVEVDAAVLGDLPLGVVGAHPAGSGHAVEVRAFVPELGVPEDPVTGSLNAGLAQWLTGDGTLPPDYTATQGARVGRAGVVSVRTVDGRVWVGGESTTCVEGTVLL